VEWLRYPAGRSVSGSAIAVAELVGRYEQAMRRRFAGLRITNEPLPDLPDPATMAPLG
jgi:hypothetical protein